MFSFSGLSIGLIGETNITIFSKISYYDFHLKTIVDEIALWMFLP